MGFFGITLRRSFSVAVISLIMGVLCVSAAEVSVNTVVAIIDDEPILLSELRCFMLLKDLSSEKPPDTSWEEAKKALEELIEIRLLDLEAEKQGLGKDSQTTATLIVALDRLLNERPEGLDAVLEMNNLTSDTLRTFAADFNAANVRGQRIIASTLRITNHEIEEFKDEMEKQGNTTLKVHVKQILIVCPNSASLEEKRRAEKRAGEIWELVKESDGISSALQYLDTYEDDIMVSDLGFVEVSQLSSQLKKAVETLDVGKYTSPLHTNTGFHILEVVDKRTVRDLLYEKRYHEERARLLDTLKRTHDVTILL